MESMSKDKRLEKLIDEARVALTAVCDHVLGKGEGDGSANSATLRKLERQSVRRKEARKAGLDTPRRRKN